MVESDDRFDMYSAEADSNLVFWSVMLRIVDRKCRVRVSQTKADVELWSCLSFSPHFVLKFVDVHGGISELRHISNFCYY